MNLSSSIVNLPLDLGIWPRGVQQATTNFSRTEVWEIAQRAIKGPVRSRNKFSSIPELVLILLIN